MAKQFELLPGRDYPLGATPDSQGCNFVIWAPDAEKVELCLFDSTENELAKIALIQKRGHFWFGYIKNAAVGLSYGYRLDGPHAAERGLLFDPQKLLLDPYTKALSRQLEWSDKDYEGDSSAMIPKSLIIDTEFDWESVVAPRHADADVILYEAHVKGFTQLSPSIPDNIRGTYLGIAHPETIQYLKDLGITAIQLLPVASYMSEPRLVNLGLSNYWGYNPICFMAPEPRYAVKDAVKEFKTMVKELHRAGIEVILDVVFNHTAEGGNGGPLLSFKGLDNRSYYCFENGMQGPDFSHYSNVTGCGNTFNADHPTGLRLVMDSLRYWVTEMHVDGFRFDLAVTIAREGGDFDPYGGFCKALLQDPILRNVKLIAEPWDIGPFGYRLGQFPSQWREINDRYRDTVRSFWRGDMGKMAEFATRLLGSRDIFPKSHRPIQSSVNFICYHDGFTLEDTVSYDNRHNQANCEENRDGHGHNLSRNYGVEGPTMDRKIRAIRLQQKKNLMTSLLLSQGMPHLLAGDEIGRTQMGNNNAYCQDNKLSWMNWDLRSEDEELLLFMKKLIQLRRQSAVFRELRLEDDLYYGHGYKPDAVHWFQPDGSELNDHDWHMPSAQALMMMVSAPRANECWLLLFNASNYDIHYKLSKLPEKQSWHLMLDTATEPSPEEGVSVSVCNAHTMKVFLAKAKN